MTLPTKTWRSKLWFCLSNSKKVHSLQGPRELNSRGIFCLSQRRKRHFLKCSKMFWLWMKSTVSLNLCCMPGTITYSHSNKLSTLLGKCPLLFELVCVEFSEVLVNRIYLNFWRIKMDRRAPLLGCVFVWGDKRWTMRANAGALSLSWWMFHLCWIEP